MPVMFDNELLNPLGLSSSLCFHHLPQYQSLYFLSKKYGRERLLSGETFARSLYQLLLGV
jgi:hypothetical protein